MHHIDSIQYENKCSPHPDFPKLPMLNILSYHINMLRNNPKMRRKAKHKTHLTPSVPSKRE